MNDTSPTLRLRLIDLPQTFFENGAKEGINSLHQVKMTHYLSYFDSLV